MDLDQLLLTLTTTSLAASQRRGYLRRFTELAGWTPSDVLEDYGRLDVPTNGHVLVEHGLDTTAAITFLQSNTRFDFLPRPSQLKALSISYNHLIDWHLFPDDDGVTFVHNRHSPLAPQRFSYNTHRDACRATAFDRLIGRRKGGNLPALDDCLVDTVSYWKRLLSAELSYNVANEHIAALFNAIFLVRALEDHARQRAADTDVTTLDQRFAEDRGRSIGALLAHSAQFLAGSPVPDSLMQESALDTFSSLDPETISALLHDFYSCKFAPYQYDFSLISKHALSRVYEKYVSLLRPTSSPQLTLFRELPAEERNRSLGGVYTPQFVASFFARFLRENLPPPNFRRLRTFDPACGSGIFLRTLLEMQCDPLTTANVEETTGQAFSSLKAIDIDANACHATRLSLSLLHLVLTDYFPDSLSNVEETDAVEYFIAHTSSPRQFDAVIANPPFIKWDGLDPAWREQLLQFMGSDAKGKTDLFLAILKGGMQHVCPGGFLLYVLPHSFLVSDSAAALRARLADEFSIRLVADLSAIPVFAGVGAYVILLIAQRKAEHVLESEPATIVRCQEFVGRALDDAIHGRKSDSEFYSIFDQPQATFESSKWAFFAPTEDRLRDHLATFPRLGDHMFVRTGTVTGADDVFIRPAGSVPNGEEGIYQPFLADREMEQYSVPDQTDRVVFYPYVDGNKVAEDEVQASFPDTYAYLVSHREALESRRSAQSGRCEWWAPVWPRPPQNMMRPKIVAPHVVLLPRFGIDARGEYAVSRAPLLYPKRDDDLRAQLLYYAAFLNSSTVFWQTASVAHRYSRGYVLLEPKTLKEVRVPDPRHVEREHLALISRLVEERLRSGPSPEIEQKLDECVADVFGLDEAERRIVGLLE